MALVSADTSAEIKNITLDRFVSRHFAKPPGRWLQAFARSSQRKQGKTCEAVRTGKSKQVVK
jgi:hypothetical protein